MTNNTGIIAAYLVILGEIERLHPNPKVRELARRVRGNVRKLAAMT